MLKTLHVPGFFGIEHAQMLARMLAHCTGILAPSLEMPILWNLNLYPMMKLSFMDEVTALRVDWMTPRTWEHSDSVGV